MDFLRSAAQAAQEQVNEFKMGARELAEDLSGYTDALVKRDSMTGNKELEFGDGPLGFRLEGTMVVSVEMGTQAARLGVEAGDRLCEVAGYTVPDFEPDDVDGEQRAMKLVKKWLKEMPRPSTLTFVPVTVEDDDDVAEADLPVAAKASQEAVGTPSLYTSAGRDDFAYNEEDMFEQSGHGTQDELAEKADQADMQALMKLAAEWQQQDSDADAAKPADVQALLAELRHEQEERRQLGAEVQRTKHAKGQAVASLNSAKAAHQKQVAELQAQLSTLREENKKALLQASAGEADNYAELETSKAREQVLEEELARLRQAVETATKATADTAASHTRKVEELSTRASAAEGRATAAELRIQDLTRELHGFCDAHEAELDLLRCERAELERKSADQQEKHTQRVRELEERAASQLAAVRQEVEEAERRASENKAAAEAAEAEASAAALEASTARAAAARSALQARVQSDQPLKEIDLTLDEEDGAPQAPDSPMSGSRDAQPDTMALYERIDTLERRVVSLQKKLNSRPVVFQSPVGGDDAESGRGLRNRPSWELNIVSLVGPRTGAMAVLLYLTVDTALRSFTKRLLKNDAWLWMFYAHLIVLYAITAASYTEITPLSGGSTVDIDLKQGSSQPAAPLAVMGSDDPVR